jgi:myo-inositol-1(or 4)-monophosphatase
MSAWLSRRLEAALAIAEEAGALAMRLRPAPGEARGTLKGRQDWLTHADEAVERFIADALAAAFPEDGFRGEETGPTRSGSLTWVVDPIDGTSNYARGAARFCVSIGILEGDRPVAGVLVAPALGETFSASAKGGAFLNGAPIRAATTGSLDRAIVEAGWSARCPDEAYVQLVTRLLAAGAMVRAGGSGALGLADVAAGRQDGYAELHINLWDVAAALVILAEAGCVVNGFMAHGGAERGAPILAAAPALADRLSGIAGIALA